MRNNEAWHVVTVNVLGETKPLATEHYTILANTKTGEFVVAWAYDSSDNTWGQGHYLHTFEQALEFMCERETYVA